jgi:alpha-beta hydrolase superfamily lysophospholipase
MESREFVETMTDGTPLHSRLWLPSASPLGVVVIVHGLGEHSGRYEFVAQHLTDAGYRVVAYDQRGHGATPGPRGHVREYEVLLNDLHDVIAEARRLSNFLPIFLYGHSFGGNVVLNYALRRKPELAGLVVTSPLLRPRHDVPLWKRCCARVLSRVWPTFSFDNHVDPKWLSRDDASVEAYRQDPAVHHRVSARLATQMLDAGRWAISHASKMRLPLLLLHGEADEVTSPAASREFASHAACECELKIWEGLFHEPHWEKQREAVLSCIVAWLTERAGHHQSAKRQLCSCTHRKEGHE